MKFFLDTGDVNQIAEMNESGLVDGITTNPSLIAKTGRQVKEVIAEIAGLVDGPVSAEVTARDHEGMMKEAGVLAALAPNVVIKVPLTPEGLKSCRRLSAQGVGVNVTLCFSASQALLAGKCGAAFVSPFVGRLDDIGERGMDLIAAIVPTFKAYPDIKTKVLVASIRNKAHLEEAARLGAEVATIPPAVLRSLYDHPLTTKGLDAFLKDWAATGQSIL